MKIDVTTIFFNSYIDGGTATAPWCVSIGQGKDKKINNDIPGLNDVLDGLIYKSISNRNWVDTSAGSKNNEYLLISKFDKIFINGVQQESLNLIGLLVREHTKSHEGRLRISFPPYASYNDGVSEFSNQDTYEAISDILGCGKIDGSGGCWFVDDISILNQDELHLSCIVVDPNGPKIYKTSQNRSSEWQSLSSDHPDYKISRLNDGLDELFKSEPLQLIFFGAPGTGKSFKIDGMTNDANCIRTTFHPDSDYASFVGAYKPTMKPMPIHAFVGTTVHHANNASNEKAFEKKIVYKYVPQAFLKAYVAAWEDLENPYFLIIEEINRGNCAQIFGDLFQLLDRNSQGASSYAINADEDISQFLATDDNGFGSLSDEQKEAIRTFVLVKDSGKTEAIGEAILNGKKLLLPPNLYIWATMNTSDQSLFPIDSAFKRRWNWEYIPIRFFENDPDVSLSKRSFQIGNTRYSWAHFLKTINPIISELTESADKQMGFFFAKPDKKSDPALKDNDVISEKVFLNKVLFYLWTDVLKDFNIGREEFKKPDGDGKPLEFADFFDDGKDYLAQFVTKLGIDEIGNGYDDEDNTSDSAIDSDKDNSNLTIVFPDGETITGPTRFDAYSKALLKIGLDKVEPIAAEMKYKRHNSPLVSKVQNQAILDAPDYTYVPFGEYFLIKGMNGKTMRNFLNLLSKRLNLGLTVNY